jgi:hypothetical protein
MHGNGAVQLRLAWAETSVIADQYISNNLHRERDHSKL